MEHPNNEHAAMAKHLQTGSKGEDLAVAFLKSNNCQILERNWRFGRAEIDIIARSDETLIFVEVKTRSTTTFGHPAEFVSHSQEQRIAEAASAYMEHINHDWAVRFDIIAITLEKSGKHNLEHFPDAFFPGTH